MIKQCLACCANHNQPVIAAPSLAHDNGGMHGLHGLATPVSMWLMQSQVFVDMAALVELQGQQLDCIEKQVGMQCCKCSSFV